MRELPPDLVRQLQTARRLEQMADRLSRQRDAISATGSLMLAAVQAGWTRTEIGAVLGMNHQTVAKRVETARQRLGDAVPGLDVEPPPRKTVHPSNVLRRPAHEREWLTGPEAARFVGCVVDTIWNWRRRGLLPNTQHLSSRVYLYLRADLQRVMRAPRYNKVGADYRALRAQIEASPI